MAGVLLAGLTGLAQPIRPAATLKASAVVATVRPGTTAKLTLHVSLPAGLHVQANKPRDPALIPTVLTVEPPKGTTVAGIVYPPPTDLKQRGAAQPLAVYPNEFEIVVNLKLAAGIAPGKLSVPARLRYQACNDRICLTPVETLLTEKLPH